MAYKEYPAQNRTMTQTFRGINRHEHIGDGEWYDMLNMTCDEYPAAKTRERRAIVQGYKTISVLTRGYLDNGYTYERGSYVFVEVPVSATPPVPPFEMRLEKQDGEKIALNCTKVTETSAGGEPALELACEFGFNQNGYKYDYVKSIIFDTIGDVECNVTPMLPGKPVDALVIDEQLIVATENGYLCGNRVLDVGAGLRQAVSYGRNIYTNNGVLTDETLETATQTAAEIGGLCEMILCNADGAEIAYVTTKPANPQNGDYYFDNRAKGLYQWSDAQEQWVAIAQNYIKLTFAVGADLGGIRAGDAVKGTVTIDVSPYDEIASGAWTVHSVHEGDADEDDPPALVLNGMIDPTFQDVIVTLRRRMPVFDFICEHNNRIFGCRYGLNDEGEFVNEVYASALGDPLNWFLYEGTANDSYTASVGAPGPWTGCCECGEYVLFFKQDKIFVLSGGVPSAFRLVPFDDFGVQAGSEKSLAVIGNVAYYKSSHGVRRISPYDYPHVISEGLGYDKWTQAVGGTDGRKYYVSMDADGERSTFVYDTWTGLWTRENEAVSAIACMVRYKTNLLVIGGTENTTAMGVELNYDEEKSAAYKRSNPVMWIMANAITRALLLYPLAQMAQYLGADTVEELLDALDVPSIFISADTAYAYDAEYVYVSNEKPADLQPITSTYAFNDFEVTGTALEEELADETDLEWFAETGNIGLDEPNEKRIRVLQIRAKSGKDASLHVQAMFDGDNAGEMLRCENRGRTGTYRVAWSPARRCDTYRLRLSGTGDTVIYSITTETEDAGDYVR